MQELVNTQEGKCHIGIKKTHGLADACRFTRLIYVCMSVHLHVCGGQKVKFRYSSPGVVHLCLTGPRLTDSVGLAGQQASGVYLSLPPSAGSPGRHRHTKNFFF